MSLPGYFGRKQAWSESPIEAPRDYKPSDELLRGVQRSFNRWNKDVLGDQNLAPDYRPCQELELDSLDIAQIGLEIEDDFDIVMSEDDLQNIGHISTSIKDICHYIETKKKGTK